MPSFAIHGLKLPEFAAALATIAVASLVLHPILAQARVASGRLPTFRPNTAFAMYAVDSDGGYGDFEGKPVLTDGLGATLARYGGAVNHVRHHAAKSPLTGCQPFLRFEPEAYVVETGTLTRWHGQVGSPSSSCSIAAFDNDSAVVLPDWGDIPVSGSGDFWLVSGALQQGVGTVSLETSTGAQTEKSILVLD